MVFVLLEKFCNRDDWNSLNRTQREDMLFIAGNQIVNFAGYRAFQYPVVILFLFDDVNHDFRMDNCCETFKALCCFLNSFHRKIELMGQYTRQFIKNKRREDQLHFSLPRQLHHLISGATGNDER